MGTEFRARKLTGQMLPESEQYPAIPEFENLPQPMNYRVVVCPREIEEVSAGGIHLAKETVESQEFSRTVACVLAIGPTAFLAEIHPAFKGDKLAIGDWVLVPRYAGTKIYHRGIEFDQPVEKVIQILNDSDIIARFDEGLKGVVEL